MRDEQVEKIGAGDHVECGAKISMMRDKKEHQ